MSEMKEKNIRVPVVDDETNYIISYEELTENEIRFIAAYKLGTEETQESIKKILNIALKTNTIIKDVRFFTHCSVLECRCQRR